MTVWPLFNLWQMNELAPLYERLRALPADEAYAVMHALHASERRSVLAGMHAEHAGHVRSRLALAPRLAQEHDLDVLAAQFADYVLELNLESVFLVLALGDRTRLFGELVDAGSLAPLDAVAASGRPILLAPLHIGPCYPSLAVLAHRHPVTTLYHRLPLDELRDRWFPDVDLTGIKVPNRDVGLRCREAFAAGRMLSIFPELDPQGIGRLHVPVPFLGTRVAAPAGTVLIAQRAGALIVPYVFESHAPGRYAFAFEQPIEPGSGRADRHEATARLFACLERRLLSGAPGKWEMWWEFERMADAEWLRSHEAVAA